VVREGEFVQLEGSANVAFGLVRGYVYSKSRGYDMGIETFDGSIIHTDSAEDVVKGSVKSLAWDERSTYGDERQGFLTVEERFSFLMRSVLEGRSDRNFVPYHGRLHLFEVGDFYRRGSGDPQHAKGEGVGWETLKGEPGGEPEGFAIYPRLWYTPNNSIDDRSVRVVVARESDRRDGTTGYAREDYEWLDTYTVRAEEKRSYNNSWGGMHLGVLGRDGLTPQEAVSFAVQSAEAVAELGSDAASRGYDEGKRVAKGEVEKALKEARAGLTKVFGQLKLEGE
jgi:NOL1/NOP2/fmu family ribosome biogenesis protein